jgi:hypothetical protein
VGRGSAILSFAERIEPFYTGGHKSIASRDLAKSKKAKQK